MAGVAPTTDVAKDEANEDDADGVARPIVRIPVMSDDQTPADIELALMESASPTQAKPGGDRLNDRLNEAKRAGRRARFSMSGPPFVIGLLCIGFGCADFVRATSFLGGALMFLVPVGAPLVFLALLPSDSRAIKAITILFAAGAVNVAREFVRISISFFRHFSADGGCTAPLLLEDDDLGLPCWPYIALGVWVDLIVLFLAWAVWRYLAGLYFYRHLPSKLLDHLFHTTGVVCRNVAVTSLVVPYIALVPARIRENVPLSYIAIYVLVTVLFVCASWMFLSKHLRPRIHARLLSIGEQSSVAAGIAALLGTGASSAGIQKEARRLFRHVALDRATEDAMAGNAPNPSLRVHTEAAQMGHVDFFMSHSWHDPPELKWTALQQFREQFKQSHGRKPKLWIDKYCIDQDNIQSSLRCLPIFLAGCDSLLIVAGETYSSRLWCIIEVRWAERRRTAHAWDRPVSRLGLVASSHRSRRYEVVVATSSVVAVGEMWGGDLTRRDATQRDAPDEPSYRCLRSLRWGGRPTRSASWRSAKTPTCSRQSSTISRVSTCNTPDASSMWTRNGYTASSKRALANSAASTQPCARCLPISLVRGISAWSPPTFEVHFDPGGVSAPRLKRRNQSKRYSAFEQRERAVVKDVRLKRRCGMHQIGRVSRWCEFGRSDCKFVIRDRRAPKSKLLLEIVS
jgi:hypothetical protein